MYEDIYLNALNKVIIPVLQLGSSVYHQLANASKHNITGNFWQQTKAYGQSYGLTNIPNTYSIRQILKNIW